MPSFLITALAWTWRNSWQAGVIVLLVLLAQWAFCRGGARRYAAMLWALVLVRLVMPAAGDGSRISFLNGVQWAIGKWSVQTPPDHQQLALTNTDSEPPLVIRSGSLPIGAAPAVATPPPLPPRSWTDWLLVPWLIGCAALAAAVFTSHHRFRRRLQCAIRVTDRDSLAVVAACAKEIGLAQPPSVWLTDTVSAPALSGLLRPRLLLPATGLELTTNELRLVVLHELAHLKRLDLWIDLFCDLLLALHWFNPLLWLARSRYRADRELARDEMVLRVVGQPGADGYARMIVALLERVAVKPRSVCAIGIVDRRAGIRRRVRHAATFAPRRTGCVLLAAAGLVFLGCATLPGPHQRAADAPRDTGPTTTWTVGVSTEHAEHPAILDERISTLTFDASPLSEVFDTLGHVTGAKFVVHWKLLESVGIPRSAPVTARLRDIKLSSVLNTVLADVSTAGMERAGWVAHDGIIEISTRRDVAMMSVSTRTYDIHDLLMPVDDVEGPPMGLRPPATEPVAPAEAPMTRQERVDAIVRLIRETIDPGSWGSIGRIKDLSGQLIVTQTEENQESLARLLDQLRETRGLQVMLDVRLLVLKPDVLERVHERLKLQRMAGKIFLPKGSNGTVVDAAQAKDLAAALAAEPAAKTLTSPRLMLFNGQRGYVMIGSQTSYVANVTATKDRDGAVTYTPTMDVVSSGVTIDAQSTISSDRRFVTCTLRPQIARLDRIDSVPVEAGPGSPKAAIQHPVVTTRQLILTVSVPDGGTLLVGGFKDETSGGADTHQNEPAKPEPPTMVKELIDGAAANDVYLMVTPTIVYSRERKPRTR